MLEHNHDEGLSRITMITTGNEDYQYLQGKIARFDGVLWEMSIQGNEIVMLQWEPPIGATVEEVLGASEFTVDIPGFRRDDMQ
jgi:hypothetical protein